MSQMLVLIFVGIAMGRASRPIWWPAALAGCIGLVTILAFVAGGEPGDVFDPLGTLVLYLFAAYYSFGTGVLWRLRTEPQN